MLDNENETYERMKKKKEGLNLTVSLDFPSALPLGNTNKEIPTGAPTSSLAQGWAARLAPLLENEGGILVQPHSLAGTGDRDLMHVGAGGGGSQGTR